MVKESVTIDEVIEFLNEILAVDEDAIYDLVETRVACNPALANHPTVQVSLQDGKYTVGLLGILNGIFGTDEDGCGPIVATFNLTAVKHVLHDFRRRGGNYKGS